MGCKEYRGHFAWCSWACLCGVAAGEYWPLVFGLEHYCCMFNGSLASQTIGAWAVKLILIIAVLKIIGCCSLPALGREVDFRQHAFIPASITSSFFSTAPSKSEFDNKLYQPLTSFDLVQF